MDPKILCEVHTPQSTIFDFHCKSPLFFSHNLISRSVEHFDKRLSTTLCLQANQTTRTRSQNHLWLKPNHQWVPVQWKKLVNLVRVVLIVMWRESCCLVWMSAVKIASCVMWQQTACHCLGQQHWGLWSSQWTLTKTKTQTVSELDPQPSFDGQRETESDSITYFI